MEEKVWFTADWHFSHKNILHHSPRRAEIGGFSMDDVEAHDKWLVDLWNSHIGKKDTVYIIGDLSFAKSYMNERLFQALRGKKNLIIGNHDGSSIPRRNYFETMELMKERVFKKKMFPFAEEDFMVVMCHYPMVTWNCKHYGSIQVHGHCHGKLDKFNESSPDLRVDVGLDGYLANYEPVPLEKLYEYMKRKTGGMGFHKYAKLKKEENDMLV